MEILVVEDEPAIREVEIAYLNKAGYSTTEVTNGQEAVDAFHKRGADLAIVDINLPLLNGLEVCRRIRDVSTIPIIIVTARDGDDDEVKGLEAGADDYVKKPFNPNVLVARVQALLRRYGHRRIVCGELVVDPEQMSVTKGGEPIALTTTQFNVLVALASRPDMVLTRDQLIEQVYSDPAGHAIYDRTIDAHIKSIRKLVEDDPAHPHYIQTVIGRGYKFGGSAS
jgi:DNA-binding response OmpR family regulator